MDYRSLLNDKQYEAVSTDSQYVRIIAGAGSGKTRVLTYRISFLISECHVDPRRILAIAFTNKVANEMNERASKLVEDLLGYRPMLHIHTFHAFCVRILREEHEVFGYPSSFTIYDEDDQTALIKSVGASMGYQKSGEIVKEAINYIRGKKARGLYPEFINPANAFGRNEKILLKIYKEYELKKSQSYALDFDDLLLKAISILQENAKIREKWQNRFDHILVDEFQDTNDIQADFMRLLVKPDTCVYVVGDPDQTIYTWRGANQKIIMNFDRDYPNAESIILNENYRSTKTILNAANKLIAHNKKRVPKDLFTNGPQGEPIVTKVCYTREKEAEFVAREILSIARKQEDANGNPRFNNIAILYRSSYLTQPFERALKDDRITYRIYGGLRFYQRAEVKDLLAYFNLMANPLDNVAFERIVNVPRRSIGDTSLAILKTEAEAKSLSEYEYALYLKENSEETDLSPRVVRSLLSMVGAIESTKDRLHLKLETPASILRDFVVSIGYFEYLKDKDEDDDNDRIGNVEALFDDINHFTENNPEQGFELYLQNVSLLSSQDDISNGNYVSLMTIHTAKGLEFDYVFVIGMQDGAFPSPRSLAETGRDGEEEERRLAYVAMTRAKKKLYCTCNTAYSYVSDSQGKPSVYFSEAGLVLPKSDFYGRDRYNAYDDSLNRRRGSSFFDDGDAISPFSQEPKKPVPQGNVGPSTNGITDWQVGDIAVHEVFGEGVVIGKQTDKIITVKFDVGVKTLLGTHPKLTKKAKDGGKA